MKFNSASLFGLALVCGLVGCQAKPPAAPADPKAFVESVYAQCQNAKDFTVLGDHAAQFFDPTTLALMGSDARITPPGQVGIWHADPFCSFGGYAEVTPVFTTKSSTATTATVEAVLHPNDQDNSGPRISYALSLVEGEWRFSDIGDKPGLRSIVSDAHAVTPLAFMQALYGHYVTEFAKDEWNFSPLIENAPAYFDPAMVALMAEDQRLNDGYAPALDFDPICGCQDTYKMQVTFTVKSETKTAATIVAHVGSLGGGAHDRTFELVSGDGRWRIHDISDKDVPSLRAFLTKANKDAAAYAASQNAASPAA